MLNLTDINDKSHFVATIVRSFEVKETNAGKGLAGIIVLTGTDQDDHELWLLDLTTKKANLLGAMGEKEYKHLRRSKKLDLVKADLEFSTKFFKEDDKRFEGRQIPTPADIATFEFEFEDGY